MAESGETSGCLDETGSNIPVKLNICWQKMIPWCLAGGYSGSCKTAAKPLSYAQFQDLCNQEMGQK